MKQTLSNFIAKSLTVFFKSVANLFFQKRYGHRAVVLETVAAVPGMVAAFFCHLESLRKGTTETTPDLEHMLHEAENERMHLMIILQVVHPSFLERMLIVFAQIVFTIGYSALYLLSRPTAHRMIEFFEAEAVISYTNYIALIDQGVIYNEPAPVIAIDYYGLEENATFREVLEHIRADEQGHHEANKKIADILFT